jgi:hypothetical protein
MPEIHYAGLVGIVVAHPDNSYDQWCSSIGFEKGAVVLGERACPSPSGAVYWSSDWDLDTAGWADFKNGLWADGLGYHVCENAVVEVQCW